MQKPRADTEIVTNKLPLIVFFINMLLLYFNVHEYTNAYFYLKSKRQHFRVFVYKSNLYFFSYELAEFRIQELFEPLFKEK